MLSPEYVRNEIDLFQGNFYLFQGPCNNITLSCTGAILDTFSFPAGGFLNMFGN